MDTSLVVVVGILAVLFLVAYYKRREILAWMDSRNLRKSSTQAVSRKREPWEMCAEHALREEIKKKSGRDAVIISEEVIPGLEHISLLWDDMMEAERAKSPQKQDKVTRTVEIRALLESREEYVYRCRVYSARPGQWAIEASEFRSKGGPSTSYSSLGEGAQGTLEADKAPQSLPKPH